MATHGQGDREAYRAGGAGEPGRREAHQGGARRRERAHCGRRRAAFVRMCSGIRELAQATQHGGDPDPLDLQVPGGEPEALAESAGGATARRDNDHGSRNPGLPREAPSPSMGLQEHLLLGEHQVEVELVQVLVPLGEAPLEGAGLRGSAPMWARSSRKLNGFVR